MTRSTNSDFYFPHHLTILSLSQLFLTHKGVRLLGVYIQVDALQVKLGQTYHRWNCLEWC